MSTNTYVSHTFRFTELFDETKIVYEFTVQNDQQVYAYVDEASGDKTKLLAHREEAELAGKYLKAHPGRVSRSDIFYVVYNLLSTK
jgi:hypothetical protein